MDVLLAAIGSVAAALLEVGIASPYLAVAGASPHPVFVFCVVWTIVVGIDSGLVWAFVGGLSLDALTGRPVGATALALLLAAGGAFVISRSLVRLRALSPVVAVPVLSVGYSLVLVILASGARPSLAGGVNPALLVPGAAYDTVLAVLFGPLAVSLHDRRLGEERLEW